MSSSLLLDLARNGTFTAALEHISKSSGYDDYFVLALLALGGAGFLTKGSLWDKPDPYHYKWFERPQEDLLSGNTTQHQTRNIAQKLEESKRDVVIFWGSQSGTAEGFANRLARDCHRRFKLDALVADLSDYDHETIALIPETKIVIFLVSTFGEGDPSDNTADFLNWLRTAKAQLRNVRYAAFGLGNSNYKYYNKAVNVVVEALDGFGARSLLPVGKADDAVGMTEEDFLDWKDRLFQLFTNDLGMQEHEPEYEPTIKTVEDDSMDTIDLFHGEPVPHKLVKKAAAATSPVGALPIKESRELFASPSTTRTCVHMELDLSKTPEIKYKTGDHLVIWPINPTEEVKLLLRTLGLEERQNIPLNILSLDPANTKISVPTPTTALALFQHYLEICAPVSRETVIALAQFAPSAESKSLLLSLGTKEAYSTFLASKHVTLARLLQHGAPAWPSLPLSFVVESLSPMTPRYYSISSSSVVSPRTAALTAVVSNTPLALNPSLSIKGLATSYLSALAAPTAPVAYPFIEDGTKLHAQIRRSTFKLPVNTTLPTILVAAGTGIAPFRAFLQEKARLKTMGKEIGPIMLFFGARDESEYLYREEVEAFATGTLKDELVVVSAFSRVPGQAKVYVQDRILEQKDKVCRLILEEDAAVFLCGSSSMAREVGLRIGETVKANKEWNDAELKTWSERQKKTKRWQEDVWG
jgi:NADPH-ferrihemoprotein reductase